LKSGLLFFFFSSLVLAESLIQPIQPIANIDHKKAELGKILFFDPSLSKDQKISCASCHKPQSGWADERKVSLGVYDRKGKVNSPTVLNAVYNFKQFWNGRAETLKEQASGPIHQSFEMDMDETEIEKRLNTNSMYQKLFYKVYHTKEIQYKDVIDAIVEFEKTLVTPQSKFDRFLDGKKTLSEVEQKGYLLFKKYGCITCHNGVNVGGNSFQKIGIVLPYENCFADRYEVTKKSFDRCVYKVPTLRNIAKTAPYFHDGSVATLQDAIKKMAYYNLGFELEDKDAQMIEAFLKTLSSDLKEP